MSRNTSQAILFVDGYNIIGAWMSLQMMRDRHGLEAARQELVEALASYSAFEGLETYVVFDAQYQDTPGSKEVITGSLTICYTEYRETADTYIERACALFRKDIRKFDHRLIVATSDRAQQLTVSGYGAELMSADQLRSEVEFSEIKLKSRQKSDRKQQPSSRFLSSAIDPEARKKLMQMRFGIREDQL
jgi:uncharacterized protein